MRTTVRLDEALARAAKAHALATGRTLTAVIADALRRELARGAGPDEEPPPLPSFRGHGLQPGVDLDSNAALLELMEGR